MAKQILVTGGAGFIGSHLCEYLLNQGHKVYCLDNLYTSSNENIKHLLDNPKFEFIKSDINGNWVCINHDEIYNLACPASPIHYQKDPIYTLETSVLGAKRILEIAEFYGSKVLQASTSEVYGDPWEHPQVESYNGNVNPIGPRACYDEGKRVAETFFTEYGKTGVDVRIARIFNTYGPRMAVDDGRVIPTFINQALNNKPITIFGTGMQTRSLCYIDDLIEGLAILMDSEIKSPVNLGNPHEITILYLAEQIIRLTNSKSEIVFKDLPQDDPKIRCPDISKAVDLGWWPEIDLEEGLKETIKYYELYL